MNYPLHLEYVKAVMNSADNFDKLKHLHPVLDKAGNPVMSSGNFAVVFKMKDTKSGNLYAVKCFTREQKGREECYKMIHDELEYVSSPYLVPMQYLEKELFVDSKAADETEFPVVFMEWINGVNLDVYIKEHLDNKAALEMLAYRFSRLASWLITQPFAHGDLKPDNILVRPDGSLVLVDYDGMYVPAMKGQKSRETGSPNFRHPARTEDNFDEHIDDFPAISILLSLKAIAADPTRFTKYAAADRLLFTEKDYRDISKCKLLKELYPSENNEINRLVSLFNIALLEGSLASVSYRLLNLPKPQATTAEPDVIETTLQQPAATSQNDRGAALSAIIEALKERAAKEEEMLLKDAWEDEDGVKYSKDGKCLISVTYKDLEKYTIRDGVVAIHKYAFADCYNLKELVIPDSVTTIGDGAFKNCRSLQDIILPRRVTTIGNGAFKNCESLQNISIPGGVEKIGDGAFKNCNSLQEICIPGSLQKISKGTFCDCKSLKSIFLSDSVTTINSWAFMGCSSFESITLPNRLTILERGAFINCKALKSIDIPETVKEIEASTFIGCDSLTDIVIQNPDCKVNPLTFTNCPSLKTVNIRINNTKKKYKNILPEILAK